MGKIVIKHRDRNTKPEKIKLQGFPIPVIPKEKEKKKYYVFTTNRFQLDYTIRIDEDKIKNVTYKNLERLKRKVLTSASVIEDLKTEELEELILANIRGSFGKNIEVIKYPPPDG